MMRPWPSGTLAERPGRELVGIRMGEPAPVLTLKINQWEWKGGQGARRGGPEESLCWCEWVWRPPRKYSQRLGELTLPYEAA